jgi:membrane-bound lytic murein transglycosylase MltF
MDYRNFYTGILLFLSLFILTSCQHSDKSSNEDKSSNDSAKISSESFRQHLNVNLGDFDMMFDRRIIRVLVPYSRTLFFNDKGKERGITAEIVRDFERYINKKYRSKLNKRPITIAIIATPRDQLLTDVIQGLGDIAAGNLTVTENRLGQVDFLAPPDLGRISEIVLTNKQDNPVKSIEELSGRTVHVRASSSYYESLQKVNKKFEHLGKEKIRIVPISDSLEDEDLMEMLDAGIISMIVVDDWKAKMWAQILPNIRLNENVAIREDSKTGWAFRKNSPLLFKELNEFYKKGAKRLGTIPYLFVKYNRQVDKLQDPTNQKNRTRYAETIKLFEKYGSKYGFDPLMLVAQGFQESKLDQSKRSHAGAVGIMQVMPSTGASMKVGNIKITESNIHAGVKYMNILMTKYFQDANFDDFNRCMFAFASYNAGPNRITKLREVAKNRGLNPDLWLDNVEIVVSEKVGWETTTYVRNIVKYYFSYKLLLELKEEQQKARSKFDTTQSSES